MHKVAHCGIPYARREPVPGSDPFNGSSFRQALILLEHAKYCFNISLAGSSMCPLQRSCKYHLDMRFVELFAGIGGFRIGLEAAGMECVFASEIDKYAAETYRLNFGTAPVGDICAVDAEEIPPHDVLTAGFPCQSFTGIGSKAGLDCAKGELFWQIVRIAKFHRPRALLLENVRGLLINKGGESYQAVVNALEEIGYTVSQQLINSASLVPQYRNRLYIVAIRADITTAQFNFPTMPYLDRKLRQILETPAPESYRLRDHQWARVTSHPRYIERPAPRLANPDGISLTLHATYKKGYMMYSQFVNDKPGQNPRFYTARECLRLQGFPDTFIPYRDTGRFYHQIGNAVSPPVIAVLGAAIRDLLDGVPVGPVSCPGCEHLSSTLHDSSETTSQSERISVPPRCVGARVALLSVPLAQRAAMADVYRADSGQSRTDADMCRRIVYPL